MHGNRELRQHFLMDIYNHSSYRITQHYLGISQDERDEIYLKLDL